VQMPPVPAKSAHSLPSMAGEGASHCIEPRGRRNWKDRPMD
jgi:hypothetical protein